MIMMIGMTMMTMLLSGRVSADLSDNNVESQGPYLDSFTIQDSCQFSLCGPEFSQEFLQGSVPKVGSCSGDCNLLAINLVSNKFIRDWLWSNCASMCQAKYDFQSYRHYKSRFQCMERCHSAYQSLSPHHNLARYCAKVSCSTLDRQSYQIDCYTGCAEHVATNVSGSDWRDWGLSLAGQCSGVAQDRTDKLTCADTHLWANIVKSYELTPSDDLSQVCHQKICNKNMKCSRDCLTAATQINNQFRHYWIQCGQREQCSRDTLQPTEKINCVEKCVQTEIEEQRKREALELERKRIQEERRQQAFLSHGDRLTSELVIISTFLMLLIWRS